MDGDLQCAAIVNGCMVLGDAGWSDVHIETGIKLTCLCCAIERGLASASSCGPVPAAGSLASLQDLTVIARLFKLVHRGESGDARAQNEHRSVGLARRCQIRLCWCTKINLCRIYW